MHTDVYVAFDLLRKRRRQNSKKIAAQLCMIIACLYDEGEGIRKKRPDRDWLRRRAERGGLCRYCNRIDQFRYIEIQPKTIDLSTRLFGINPTNSIFIPTSLVLRSIVLG